MATTTDGTAGRCAFSGLDRALHERARLGVMVALAGAPDGCRFAELKASCALTDGNLSRHLDVLRAAGLVEIWKGYDGRRPQTICRLTADGRRRFRAYLLLLEGIVDAALGTMSRRAGRRRPPAGFSRACVTLLAPSYRGRLVSGGTIQACIPAPPSPSPTRSAAASPRTSRISTDTCSR